MRDTARFVLAVEAVEHAGDDVVRNAGAQKRERTQVMMIREHTHSQTAGSRRVVVVGGANTDIAGLSDAPLVARDSNPGHVRASAGGVARNIAENLARLGAETHLVTAFGGDHNGRELAETCRDSGIDVEGSLTVASLPGSVYLSIMDEGGDMALALSDMRPLDAVTPEALEMRAHIFDTADLVVADTNLPAESLVWLVENARVPIVLDAVSVAKATRAKVVLSRLHTVKASGLEAGALLGREIRNRDQAEEAARELVALGVTAAFVTTGAFGVAWADAAESGHLASPNIVEIRNATGAGDAFAAGIAYATLEAWPTLKAAAFGSACAALALESEETVSARMSRDLAMARMEAMLA